MQGDQVEGEQLNSSTIVEGEHTFQGKHDHSNVDVEGEYGSSVVNVEGEHWNVNPIIKVEKTGFIPSNSNNQAATFYEMNDDVSNAGEDSEMNEMFEDAPLDFDPAYAPMDRWTRSYPKEQVLVILKLEC